MKAETMKENKKMVMTDYFVETIPMTVDEIAKNYDHSKFNRNINDNHVNKLKSSIDNYGMFMNITVNRQTGSIVDGNHRTEAVYKLQADKKLSDDFKILVNIVDMSEDIEKQIIQEIQHSSKHWTCIDHIDSYCKNKNENYINFVDFCMSHELTHNGNKINSRYALPMIKGSRDSGNLNKGTFTCTDEEIATAHIIHDEVKDILNIWGLKCGAYTEPMINLWFKFRKLGFTFNQWKRVFKKSAIKNMVLRSPKSNMSDWEIIFNKAYVELQNKK